MVERRTLSNFGLIFLVLIIYLSIWQIKINNLQDSQPISSHYVLTPIPIHTINTINSTYIYPTKYLPTYDYGRLMDLVNFKFTILNECLTPPVLLVFIHTSPANIDKRKTIRQTWGRSRENLKIVFMLGEVNNINSQKRLIDENKKHKDIVQGTFLDAYRNLTYKHVMALKYVIYHCPLAKYILKTDDDVFVNMPMMMDFLTVDLSPYGAKNLLSCSPLTNSPARRTFRSKWRVTFAEYRNRYYPTFCPGWFILYSPDVLFTLYQDVQKAKYFWIDDVLITGILAQKKNIQHTNIESLVLSSDIVDKIIKKHDSYNNSIIFLLGPPNLSVKKMNALWNFVKNHNITRPPLKDHR